MNTNHLRPFQGKVLVQFLEPDDTEGMFHLPAKYREKPKQAIVRRIGIWKQAKKSRGLIPYDFKVGDRVIVRPEAGTGIRRNIGERLRMVRSDQIEAVIENV